MLSRTDVAALMTFDEYVTAVADAFKLHAAGSTQLPPVVGVSAPDGAFHVKTGATSEPSAYVAVKVNGNFPNNAARLGLPTIQGAIFLCDGTNGRPLALLDSIEITIQRTAAATILAARHLARPESAAVTICGCGNQGRVTLAGLKTIFPIERAYAFDINETTARDFATRMSRELDIDVTHVAGLADAAKRSDIIVTCSPSRRPLLGPGDVSAGAFVAAVGADSHDKQELDPHLVAQNKLVVDIPSQCATIGELHHALAAGLMTEADVYAELADIVARRKPGRSSKSEIIVFDSTGAAIQDVTAAAAVYAKAQRQGVGVRCPLA